MKRQLLRKIFDAQLNPFDSLTAAARKIKIESEQLIVLVSSVGHGPQRSSATAVHVNGLSCCSSARKHGSRDSRVAQRTFSRRAENRARRIYTARTASTHRLALGCVYVALLLPRHCVCAGSRRRASPRPATLIRKLLPARLPVYGIRPNGKWAAPSDDLSSRAPSPCSQPPPLLLSIMPPRLVRLRCGSEFIGRTVFPKV